MVTEGGRGRCLGQEWHEREDPWQTSLFTSHITAGGEAHRHRDLSRTRCVASGCPDGEFQGGLGKWLVAWAHRGHSGVRAEAEDPVEGGRVSPRHV